MQTEIITTDKRRELCRAEDVTLNGKPAVICGARSPFATVAHLGDPATGLAVEFAWPTVARIVASGGAFKS